MYYNIIRDTSFKKSDAFIGFQKDTPASVIFQATNQLRLACSAIKDGSFERTTKWRSILEWSGMVTDNWEIEEEDPGAWKEAVSYVVSILLADIIIMVSMYGWFDNLYSNRTCIAI